MTLCSNSSPRSSNISSSANFVLEKKTQTSDSGGRFKTLWKAEREGKSSDGRIVKVADVQKQLVQQLAAAF